MIQLVLKKIADYKLKKKNIFSIPNVHVYKLYYCIKLLCNKEI